MDNENILDAHLTSFTSKEKLFYRMIDKFFKNCSLENKTKMYNIIDENYHISLRLLDWFVVSYSKTHCICYELNDQTIDLNDNFNVHISYKAQLKSYKKKYFDAFRRSINGRRFWYVYNKNEPDKKLCTTIGQLNFFRWAFNYGIIDYVENNYNNLTIAMTTDYKDEKKKKKVKPHATPNNPNQNPTIYSDDVTLSFD